jgi:polyphosphate kinase
VPPILPRFVQASAQRFVPLEDVIAAHLPHLFPGMDVLQHHTFRVTRNEDLDVEEDDVENILQALERELMRRRFGPARAPRGRGDIDPHRARRCSCASSGHQRRRGLPRPARRWT